MRCVSPQRSSALYSLPVFGRFKLGFQAAQLQMGQVSARRIPVRQGEGGGEAKQKSKDLRPRRQALLPRLQLSGSESSTL